MLSIFNFTKKDYKKITMQIRMFISHFELQQNESLSHMNLVNI